MFVRDVLRHWGLEGLVDTASLLVSELATNVVLHARTPFAVVVHATGDGAEVDVLDKSRMAPLVQRPDVSGATGRGLLLVSSLADDWGATPAAELGGYTKGVRFSVA